MKKVLVVDDSATIRTAVAWTLNGPTVQVVSVGAGSEVIRAIETELPRLVLVDLGLPDGDGFQVVEQIRARFGVSPPVVLMTPALEPYDEARGAQVGVHARVPKPFSTHQLLEVVSPLLGLESQPAPPMTYAGRLAARRAAEASVAPQTQLGFSAPANETGMDEGPFSVPLLVEADVETPAVPAGPELEPPTPPVDSIEVEVDVWSLADEPDDGIDLELPSALEDVPPTAPPRRPPPLVESQKAEALASPEAPLIMDQLASEAARTVAEQVQVPGLSKEDLIAVAREAIEKVAWEVVPDLAEAIIREELDRLTRPG